ncbi:MAG: hypothetical protein H6605_07620 [Flavobacteriales bacterium]|nr:hypothetical protein [Flavobacteriales bacterium]
MNKQTLLLALIIGIPFVSISQTKYGDGSMELKSEYKEFWDPNTTKYIPLDSSIYEHDAQGRMTNKLQHRFDKNSDSWIPYYVYHAVYDSKGNNISYVDSNLLSAEFGNRYRINYEYDQNNNMVKFIEYNWDENSSDWVPSQRGTSTYTSSNKESSDLRERYDAQKGQWVNSVLRSYTFNGNDDLIFYIKQNYNESIMKWEDNYKVINYVNSNQTDDSVIYQKFDLIKSEWVNDFRYIYTYNQGNRLLSRTEYKWINNIWKLSYNRRYSYTADNQYTSEEYDVWDDLTSKLIPYSKSGNQYNSKLWVIQDSSFKYNKSISSFEPTNRYRYFYNQNGYQYMGVSESYNTSNGVWQNPGNVFYRYVSKPVNSDNNVLFNYQGFKIFPNPVIGTFVIEQVTPDLKKCTVKIRDQSGCLIKTLLDKDIFPQTGLYLSKDEIRLTPGLYYIDIQSENGNQVLKLGVN